jgi:hypothetical protein
MQRLKIVTEVGWNATQDALMHSLPRAFEQPDVFLTQRQDKESIVRRNKWQERPQEKLPADIHAVREVCRESAVAEVVLAQKNCEALRGGMTRLAFAYGVPDGDRRGPPR